MDKNSISVKDLTKSYKEKTIFDRLSLDIKENKITSIYGESGSGKTTLLYIIGMIEGYEKGEIKIFGDLIPKLSSKQARIVRREKIAFLFQNYGLIEEESVKYNLNVGNRKYTRDDMKKVLKRVGLSYLKLTEKVFKLSGGEKQRISMARVILKDSKIILADEPTGSLDNDNKIKIFDLLVEERNRGKTVVIVTHDKYIMENSDVCIEIKNPNK